MPSRHSTAFRSPAALLVFLVTAVVGIILDQWTKIHAFNTIGGGWAAPHTPPPFERHTYAFIPGWLHFEVTWNPGAVFGLGQGRVALFICVSVAAVLFIFYLFAVSGRQRFYQFILGMLLAGVLGNLYDRLKFQAVRDMIHALPKWGVFPYIFNVADTLLCVGVGLMILHSFLYAPGKERRGK